MTTRPYEYLGGLVLVVAAGVAVRGYVDEHKARVSAEATTRAKEAIISRTNEEIKTRDAQADAYTQLMKDQADQIQTPQQAVRVIVRYLPAPPGQPPPTISVVDRAQLSPELQASLPDSPSFSLLTATQTEQIARDELACDATRRTLAACQADKVDLHTQVTAKGAEADALQAATKGGTKLQRFTRVLKFVGCAAGGAGLGALADRNHVSGPTIGAAAGVAGCSLF